MKGRRTSGTTTDPSSCWLFSRIATIMRGTAHAVALSVWANAVAAFLAAFFGRLPAGSAPLPLSSCSSA